MKIEASELRKTSDFETVLSSTIEFRDAEEVKKRVKETEEESMGIWDSFKVYVRRNSGVFFGILTFLFVFMISAITANAQVNINRWALSPESKNNSYLYIQLMLNGAKVIVVMMMAVVLHYSKLFQSIHDDIIKSLLFAPLSYFERVPAEKIVTTISNDLSINDKILTVEFVFLLTNTQIFCHLFGIVYVYFIFH